MVCRCTCRRISRLIIRLFTVSVVWFVGGISRRLGPLKTLFGVVQARSCLKCSRPDVSPYRGVSAWIPSDVASQLLDVAVSVNGGVIMRKTEPPLMTIADTMAYLQCSRRLSCWVPNSGALLGTGNVGIGVHFRTFSVCAVCFEIVGIPPFWHEKRASGFLRKPSRRSQRDSNPRAAKHD